jgi:hypothetical protein
MRALGASRLLHIAFDNRTVVGGLCFTVGSSPDMAEKLETLIVRIDHQHANQHIVSLCLQAAARASGDSMVLPESLVKELAAAVAQLRLRRHSLNKHERDEFVRQICSGMYLTNTGSARTEPSPEGIKSIALLDVPLRSSRLLRHGDLLNRLAVELKSTPEAAALNDEMIMRQVTERLHSDDTEGQPKPFEQFAADALGLALDVTNSQGGAIYTVSTERDVAFSRITAQGSLPFPEVLAQGRTGALSAVVYQNKTLQLHKWPFPKESGMRHGGRQGTFLLTPVGGPGGDPVRPAIGALILFREDTAYAFDAYDLALARNVTLRIALARTTDVLARIGAITTRLRARTDWQWVAEGPDPDGWEQLKALGVALPSDVRAAIMRIGPAVRDLVKLTDSLSVTLRLALPVADVEESHGLALVRIASSPAAPWEEEMAVIREQQGGLNWQCMRRGEPVYEARVDVRRDYLLVRPRTVCELVMPVRMEGWLIGTLNLESSVPDAFSPVQPLVASFAGALGRTLADARASFEERVIDGAARALNHRHSMESRLEELSAEIAKGRFNPALRRSLQAYINKIKVELSAMRRPPSTGYETDATLEEILHRAVKDVDFLGPIPEERFNPILSTRISGHRTKPLQVAIANILSNLMNYTAVSRDGFSDQLLTEIEVSGSSFQGESQAIFTFLNYSDSYLDPEKIANLYRCPVPSAEGRLRVGAFLAGLNARRAGAWLHSAVSDDRRTLRTKLVVRLEDS